MLNQNDTKSISIAEDIGKAIGIISYCSAFRTLPNLRAIDMIRQVEKSPSAILSILDRFYHCKPRLKRYAKDKRLENALEIVESIALRLREMESIPETPFSEDEELVALLWFTAWE